MTGVQTCALPICDQKLHDSIHGSDFRRARAGAQNIVPTTSNANKALEWIMPEIKGKIKGGAVRVPVIVGSSTELYCNIEKSTTVEEINAVFKAAAEGNNHLLGTCSNMFLQFFAVSVFSAAFNNDVNI